MAILCTVDVSVIEYVCRNDTLGSPSKMGIFLQTQLPLRILQLRAEYSGSKMMAHTRQTAKLASDMAENLILMKMDELKQGKAQKDLLSLLGEFTGTF